MRDQTLTLIGSKPAVLHDPRVKHALADWPTRDCPPVMTTTVPEVLGNPSLLDHSGVIWVLLDHANTPHLFKLVGILQDRHIPAMITQPNENNPLGTPFRDGLVVAPLSAPPQWLCATLRTLWSQAGVVQCLKVDIKLLQAHHGGLCDQIDKIDEELRLAAKLQREFLPEILPSCPNAEFRVLYRPAGYVSGDVYDVIRLDENHVGFFIADAAGHGVPAALMTMWIKRSLPSTDPDPASETGRRIVPPDEAMARLNDDMVTQQTGRARFATACYGVINCHTMELRLARAGHPFPFLLRSDGSIVTLEPEGMLLGVFRGNHYELATCRLEPGDRLLLYSDGFEMAFPQPANEQDFDICPANTRYADEFKDLGHGSLDEALQRLEYKLDQQIGSLNQRDDLTVLCLSARAKSDINTGQTDARTQTAA